MLEFELFVTSVATALLHFNSIQEYTFINQLYKKQSQMTLVVNQA